MKVILTGSTGFIGGEVLSQCIRHPSITSIIVLSRREILDVSSSDEKTKVVIVDNFASYPENVVTEIADADACIW
jgi:hypothetical protein